jgi:hypothetical protein
MKRWLAWRLGSLCFWLAWRCHRSARRIMEREMLNAGRAYLAAERRLNRAAFRRSHAREVLAVIDKGMAANG